MAELFGIPAVFAMAAAVSLALLAFRRNLTDAALDAAEAAAPTEAKAAT